MSHVPAYVYLILAVLLYLGIASCYPRRLHPARLVIMPAVLLLLGFRSFLALFPTPTFPDLAAALAGGALGFSLGWYRAGRWRVMTDRAARRIAIPGDPAMLAILLGSFAFQFALRYGMAAGAAWVAAPGVQPLAAALWAWFAGLAAGSSTNLMTRYRGPPAAAAAT
ncbi:hypothetical protein [Plastoroseomonas hellenica]|uniref:hypothetical protein n=1 Tax=Plastoroseomonas hellenica TaxID=2687306 RepID=UPI001BA63719|nr:hypothetical protein [Plastoroseomonas hellenica]MBR0644991.1 hypothetical protein [Plastoroseomonas hellenica]